MAAPDPVTVTYKLYDSDEVFHTSLDAQATVDDLLEKIRKEKNRPELDECVISDSHLDGRELLANWTDTTLLLTKQFASDIERVLSIPLMCRPWRREWPMGLADKVPGYTEVFVSDKVAKFRMDTSLRDKGVKRVAFRDKSLCVAFRREAFSEFAHLQEIWIPDRVERIGKRCFFHCGSLKTVHVGKESQIATIKSLAFAGSGITRFQIPPKVETLPMDVFEDCKSLEEVAGNEHLSVVMNCVLDKSNTLVSYFPKFKELIFVPACAVVKAKTFVGRGMTLRVLGIGGMEPLSFSQTSIKHLYVTPGIEEICEYGFDGSSIERIEFAPDSVVRRFGMRAFPGVKSITIPTTVEEIGELCFGAVLSEIKFAMPSKLRVIRKQACMASEITSIWIPPSVEELGDECFVMCLSLKRVDFAPDTKLKRIGIGTFSMTGLREFTVPASVEFIGRRAFAACSALNSFEFENRVAEIEIGSQILMATPLGEQEEAIVAKFKQDTYLYNAYTYL